MAFGLLRLISLLPASKMTPFTIRINKSKDDVIHSDYLSHVVAGKLGARRREVPEMIVSKYVGLWQVLRYGDTTETLICNYNLLFFLYATPRLCARRCLNDEYDDRSETT